jgi:exopolyphosphatase/guanosine-5'-triphosphate,3'-diphosphate pyrophosphatase
MQEKLCKLMLSFKMLIDLYEVKDYMLCATSALREASNRSSVIDRVKAVAGVEISVISGDEEAHLINLSISHLIDEKCYLHIDVGGGSTELNLYDKGEKVASASFQVGSVRNMHTFEKPEVWVQLEEWINEEIHKNRRHPLIAIGTGGNINKIYELSRKKSKKNKSISLNELSMVQLELSQMSMEERLNNLMLNPDRADVIVPASEIYVHVMRRARVKTIMVPDMGLKDGIIEWLYRKNKKFL